MSPTFCTDNTNWVNSMGEATVVKGHCHCGNISYQFSTQIPTDQIAVRQCGCSFCTMHGGVYTSDPEGELRYHIKDKNQVNRYRFGHQTADFIVCKTCGVMPFVISDIGGNTFAVLNVNTAVDPIIPMESIARSDFDGEGTEDRVTRRRQNWIGTVIEG